MQRRRVRNHEGSLLSYADLITNLLIFFIMLLSAAEISRAKMQKISQGLSGEVDPMSLAQIQEQIDTKIQRQGLEELIATKLTDDGLELSLNSGIVFDSGRADILPDMVPVLDSMLQTLEPYAAAYHFAVEGHTDSRPITPGGQYRSNWELSTERAHAVRRRLDVVGIEEDKVRVEGYADTRPLPTAELDGLSEEAVLARHRRVVVRIY